MLSPNFRFLGFTVPATLTEKRAMKKEEEEKKKKEVLPFGTYKQTNTHQPKFANKNKDITRSHEDPIKHSDL